MGLVLDLDSGDWACYSNSRQPGDLRGDIFDRRGLDGSVFVADGSRFLSKRNIDLRMKSQQAC